ncbi:DUF3364 domain-containing protein [Bradyrhizobium sp. RDM12]
MRIRTDPADVDRIKEWSKTSEYREKNFAREGANR